MTNPFGDVEREAEEYRLRHLAMAEALDRMERDVTSWEADFLDSILKQLREEKRALTQKQIDVLNRMCSEYDVDLDDLG